MSETRDPPPPQRRPDDVENIFLDLCDLPPEQVAAELERRTAGNASLKAAVQSLLDAHRRAASFSPIPPFPTRT